MIVYKDRRASSIHTQVVKRKGVCQNAVLAIKRMQSDLHWLRDLNIAYLGGGSTDLAWKWMVDLAMEPQLCGEIRLFDIDTKAAKNNEMIGNLLSKQDCVQSKWSYRATNRYEEALSDADFVLISIEPGDFSAQEIDVHYPERYGIYQTVGDTIGPGGIIRSMRTIPSFVEFANRIKQYCPKAWVINCTNPMAICLRTLYETFPQIKAIGYCSEINTAKAMLKTMYEWTYEEPICSTDIEVNVVGLNHFTWITDVCYRGLSLVPMFESYVRKHYEDKLDVASTRMDKQSLSCDHRVKFSLFLKYGYIAAAGDQHLVEFFPASKYLKDEETMAYWNVALASVLNKKEQWSVRCARAERLMQGEERLQLQQSGSDIIQIIAALCGLHRIIKNVNIPNYAHQITNLPETTIVEVNALLEQNHVRPIYVGDLPDSLYRLILPHAMNQQRIYKAGSCYDPELVVEAMECEPLLKDMLPNEVLQHMTYEMLEKTKQYLPKQWEL